MVGSWIDLIGALVILIGMGLVLWRMVCGRRLSNTPACPKCRYYLRDLNGCICPECGNDVCATGVLCGKNVPVARWIRALVVVLLAWVLFATYARNVFTPFQDFSDAIFGRNVDYTGDYRIKIGFHPNASQVDSLMVEIDGGGDSITAPITTSSGIMSAGDAQAHNVWADEIPMRVALKWHDGRTQELLLTPVLNDSDEIIEWELAQLGQSSDVASETVEVVDPNKTPSAYPKKVTAQNLDDHVADWMAKTGPLNDPWDPARFVMARSIARMQLIHSRKASGAEVHDLLGESSRAHISSSIGGNFMTMSRPVVRALWLVLGLWAVVWLVVLIVVLIPGTRYEPWPLRTT